MASVGTYSRPFISNLVLLFTSAIMLPGKELKDNLFVVGIDAV